MGDKFTPELLSVLLSCPPSGSSETNSPTTSEEIVYDQCYSVNVFSEVAGYNFRKSDGIYFPHYGGGPEGGVVFSVNGNVYNVNREWLEPFTMKKIEGSPRFVVNDENPDLMRQLKDGEEPADGETEFDPQFWHEDKWATAKANYDDTREVSTEETTTPKSAEESPRSASSGSSSGSSGSSSGSSEVEFDNHAMPPITDKAFQTRVYNYNILDRAEKGAYEGWNFLRVQKNRERIKLNELANEFWAAAKEKEAAKADK